MEKKVVPAFSVAICTYNGELRLPKLLAALACQKTDCDWEVVIVDNNSCDRTAHIIHQTQSTWRSTVPLRYCFEPEQGLAFARRRALTETRSPLIGFLDDDTLPAANWVEAALTFAQQHPEVGAYGSSIEGVYEIPPPAEFKRIACCLAVIDRGNQAFPYAPDRGVLPAGAGMVVSRQAWQEQVLAVPALSGVNADSLAGKGEDIETLSYIHRAWPIWHNPAMQLCHLIPKARLEQDYLLNLFWQIGISRYPLRRLRYRRWQWPLMAWLYIANDLRKILWHLITRGFNEQSKQRSGQPSGGANEQPGQRPDRKFRRRFYRKLGTVSACEFSLLLGSLWSPVSYYRHRYSHAIEPLVRLSHWPLTTGQR
ncbi:MAG: hormogonium polysaccharide biosynthesis glycosyltransferase HpsE [Phormidesmis sp.]